MMIALNNDNVKTIVDEKHRIDNLICISFLEGRITWRRDLALQDMLSRADSAADDFEAFIILERVEMKLNCRKCGGSGYVVRVDGFDTDFCTVATDSEIVHCPVCGG